MNNKAGQSIQHLGRLRPGMIVWVTFLMIIFPALSGCEPLRKKFIRKKKQQSSSQFIPVLEPMDYPDKVETPGDLYRHHYSLWQVWQKELISVLEDGGSDKKIIYVLNQVLTHLEQMQKLVVGDKQELLKEHLRQLRDVKERMSRPAALRDYTAVLQSVESIDRQIRKNFKVAVMGESIAK